MVMPEFKQLVEQAKKEIREIDVHQLKQLQNNRDELALIDVREKEDADKEMIPGAVHVSRGMLEYNIDQVTTDKDKKIVLYCGGGSRSALAAASLQKMGFRNVHSLAGGFKAWKAST